MDDRQKEQAGDEPQGGQDVFLRLGIVVDAGFRGHHSESVQVVCRNCSQYSSLFVFEGFVDVRGGECDFGKGTPTLAFAKESKASFAPFVARLAGAFAGTHAVGRTHIVGEAEVSDPSADDSSQVIGGGLTFDRRVIR